MNKLSIHYPNELHLGAVSQIFPTVQIDWLQVRRGIRLPMAPGRQGLGDV